MLGYCLLLGRVRHRPMKLCKDATTELRPCAFAPLILPLARRRALRTREKSKHSSSSVWMPHHRRSDKSARLQIPAHACYTISWTHCHSRATAHLVPQRQFCSRSQSVVSGLVAHEPQSIRQFFETFWTRSSHICAFVRE